MSSIAQPHAPLGHGHHTARPWRKLPKIDLTAATAPVPTHESIASWPSSTDKGAKPQLLLHLEKTLREHDLAVKRNQATGNATVEQLANLRIIVLQSVFTDMRRSFKVYGPIYSRLGELIDEVSEDLRYMMSENGALRQQYAVAESGVVSVSTAQAANSAKFEAELASRDKKIAELVAEYVDNPQASRRDLQDARKRIDALKEELGNYAQKLESTSGQLVTKNVRCTYLEAEVDEQHHYVFDLRQDLANRDALVKKLECDVEFARLDADKLVAERTAELREVQEEANLLKRQLDDAQRTIAALELHGSPGKRGSGGHGLQNRGAGASDAAEFNWDKLCAATDNPELHQQMPNGDRGKHLRDMNQAERIKHMIGLWRRAKAQLKLADEFILANGLVRDEVRQDFAAICAAAAVEPPQQLAASPKKRSPVQSPPKSPVEASQLTDGGENASPWQAAEVIQLLQRADFNDLSLSRRQAGFVDFAPENSLFSAERWFVPLAGHDGMAASTSTSLVPALQAVTQQLATAASAVVAAQSAAALPSFFAWTHPGPVHGSVLSVADCVDELRQFFGFFRRCRAANQYCLLDEAFGLWLTSTKHTLDPRRRTGFAYSLWYVIESSCSRITASTPLEFIMFLSMWSREAPSDFIDHYAQLEDELRQSFRRRRGKFESITRPALQSVLRRVLTWYDTDDLGALLSAADNTTPYANASEFDEETLFNADGAFLRVLCHNHVCHTISLKNAMRAAIQRINATTAVARAGDGGGVMNDTAAAKKPARRRQSIMASGTTKQGVAAAVAAPMIRYSDAFRALVNVDPEKPRKDTHAMLGRLLGWDLERYGVVAPRAPRPTRRGVTVPASPDASPGADSLEASVAGTPRGDASASARELAVSSGTLADIPDDEALDDPDAETARRKALLTELNERWIDKAHLLHALDLYAERRVTQVPSWPLTRSVGGVSYNIQLSDPPVQTRAPPKKAGKRPMR